MTNKIHIIGIGDDALEGATAQARRLIEEADLLLGAESTLKLIPKTAGKERVAISGNLEEAVQRVAKAGQKKIVVLASGDPLFYGVARYLCDKLGKDRFEVLPHVSSMQLAFARVKESWEDAYLTNLATHSLESVIEKIRVADTVGLFTSDDHPPAAVAKRLLDERIDYFHAYVCENLGSPDERVTQGTLAEIAREEFAPLNVMILVRPTEAPDRPTEALGLRRFGNPDEMFLQARPKRGLLTPAEVRSVALAEMAIGTKSIIWDIGAGSGSVSIEAAMLASEGQAFAIEMDPEDINLIKANAERFRVKNLTAVLGRAGSVERFAQARLRFCRRQWSRDFPAGRFGVCPVEARRPVGRQRRQHRKSGGRPRKSATPSRRRASAHAERGPRDVPTGTRAVRSVEPDVFVKCSET